MTQLTWAQIARWRAARHYVVAAYEQRNYLMSEAFKPRAYRTGGWISPVVLVDGLMAGVWGYEQKRSTITVTVELFAPVSKGVKEGIEGEAARLGKFLGGDVELGYK